MVWIKLLAHIDIVHHFSKQDGFTRVRFNDHIKQNFVPEVVPLSVNKHEGSAVMPTLGRSLHFDLQLEKVVWPYIFRYKYTALIELLIACNHHKLDTFRYHHSTSVLESPSIFDVAACFENAVFLQRLVVEFSLVL